MKKHLIGLLTVALLALTAVPVAQATTVHLRVEGKTQTILPETTVTLPTAPILKDGTHACAPDSIGGAFESSAIGSDWDASYGSFGYFLSGIKGESPAGNDYFTLWVNHKSTFNGVCDGGAGVGLQEGDDVLVFVDYCDYDPGLGGCANAPVLPLAVDAPAKAKPGTPFTVTVSRYDANGVSAPVDGATVGGGAATVVTDASGHATVTLATGGPRTLSVTKDGFARVSTAVCASTGSDGNCGSLKPPPPPDTRAPQPKLAGVKQHTTYSAKKAPRLLEGTIAADASGLKDVELRLTRNDRRRCSYFDGADARWHKSRKCVATAGTWFSVGDREDFSYQLPAKLKRGRYVLDVRATDGKGNVTSSLFAGYNRVVFRVS
jgi:hypothetical protein